MAPGRSTRSPARRFRNSRYSFFMFGQGPRAVAALAALLVSLQLSACGGGSTPDTTGGSATVVEEDPGPKSGAPANAWNHVNEELRGDILSFGKTGSKAELAAAAAVARDYLTARATGDFAAACSYLSKYMLEVTKGSAEQQHEHGCANGVARLSSISSVDEKAGPVHINPSS